MASPTEPLGLALLIIELQFNASAQIIIYCFHPVKQREAMTNNAQYTGLLAHYRLSIVAHNCPFLGNFLLQICVTNLCNKTYNNECYDPISKEC